MVVNGGIQKTNDILIENNCIEKIQCSITDVSDAKKIDVESTIKNRIDNSGCWWYHKLHGHAQYIACDTGFENTEDNIAICQTISKAIKH